MARVCRIDASAWQTVNRLEGRRDSGGTTPRLPGAGETVCSSAPGLVVYSRGFSHGRRRAGDPRMHGRADDRDARSFVQFGEDRAREVVHVRDCVSVSNAKHPFTYVRLGTANSEGRAAGDGRRGICRDREPGVGKEAASRFRPARRRMVVGERSPLVLSRTAPGSLMAGGAARMRRMPSAGASSRGEGPGGGNV